MEIVEPIDADGFYKARHTISNRIGLIPFNFVEFHKAATVIPFRPSPAQSAPVTSLNIGTDSVKKKKEEKPSKETKEKKSTFAKLFSSKK